MKKFLAILLAAMMLLSVASVAMADEPTYTDVISVTIHKAYKLIGEGTSPAETFTLEQVGDGEVTDGEATTAPALDTITGAAFAEGAATADGATADIIIQLPSYEHVGVYEYTLREVVGATAGVTYRTADIKLVVTVVEENGLKRIAAVHTESEGTKSDTFENTYSAGKLNVTKTVTGNLGDKTKYFEFKVTLTGESGKTCGASYAVTGGSYADNPTSIEIGEETTFYLKDGDTITIENLPYGVSYTVTETEAEGYTTTQTDDTGTISAAAQTADFINNKTGEIDTGVVLDTLPYVLVLAVVGAAVIAMIAKKRNAED